MTLYIFFCGIAVGALIMAMVSIIGQGKKDKVRHGYWKNNHNGTFTCSVCEGKSSKMPWCGHCGATMDGKEDK